MERTNMQNVDADSDSFKNACFLTELENDLQLIFNRICSKFETNNACFQVKDHLKRGSLFHKGDFFLSLRSNHRFFLEDVQKQLLASLNEIPYILKTEIDEQGNLILCLNRSALYKIILKRVVKYGKNYGMKTTNKSFFVLVHNEVFKSFDALRIAIVSNHLISFLTTTGAKVFVNEYRKDAELVFKEVPTYACSDVCLHQMSEFSELIENLVKDSEWSAAGDETGCTIVNLKNFVSAHSLCYGKDVDNINISKKHVVINQTAYVAHFQQYHGINSDYIVHICSDNERRKVIDSGLMINMLDLSPATQIFILCQTTVFKDDEVDLSVNEFIDCHYKEINKAMAHKFNSNTLADEIWKDYLKTLVDTSIKFYFLRAGSTVPLKIDILSEQNAARSNKNAIFVQYNFARLSNVLETFELKVKEGYYKNLPPLDDIDFSLLKLEEEWNLLNFILAFPRLVEEIFFLIISKQIYPVSRVCIMLIKLSSCFSVYYSRIHILGFPQPQSQKIMFARLWLLKGIYQIMSNSFALLNIKGLNKM